MKSSLFNGGPNSKNQKKLPQNGNFRFFSMNSILTNQKQRLDYKYSISILLHRACRLYGYPNSGDLTSLKYATKLCTAVLERFGGFHTLFRGAGGRSKKPLLGQSPLETQKLIKPITEGSFKAGLHQKI